MKNPFAGHISDRDLVASVDGASLAPSASGHLNNCDRCAARFAKFRNLDQALRRSWGDVATPPQPRPNRMLPSLAGLSVAAVLIVLALSFRPIEQAAQASESPTTGHTPAASGDTHPVATGPVAVVGPIGTVEWRPDGTELLISGQDGVRRVDGDGTVLESLPSADAAVWVDNNDFAVWQGDVSASSVGTVSIRGIDGHNVVIPGTYESEMVGSGHGALALAPATSASPGGDGTFVVWTAAAIHPAMAGIPLGWSPNGTQLVVGLGPVDSMGADIQQVNVAMASLPALDARAITGLRADPKYQPAFSADGQYVAFSCATMTQNQMCGQAVTNLGTSVSRVIAHQPIGLPLTWLPEDRLLLASASYPGQGGLTVWQDGHPLSVLTSIGSSGVAASTGAIAVTLEDPATGGTVTVYSASGSRVNSLPGISGIWSPDGTTVAVLPSDPSGRLILVRVPAGG